jgi:hypothetical protein
MERERERERGDALSYLYGKEIDAVGIEVQSLQ